MDRKITFKAKKDILGGLGAFKIGLSRGNVYPGILHKDGSVTAETPYFEGISDYVDIDSIEII